MSFDLADRSIREQWIRIYDRVEPADISDGQDDKFFFEKFELMLAMAQLAFESDSTRIITLMLDAFRTPIFKLSGRQDATESYHGLSHHIRQRSEL